MKATNKHFVSQESTEGRERHAAKLNEFTTSAIKYLSTPKRDHEVDGLEMECSQALQELDLLERKSHAECLEQYNEAYLHAHRQQTTQIQDAAISEKIRQEISTLQARLNAKYYGWKHKPWNSKSEDSHDMYESLVQAENHSFPLEEPVLSRTFFENIGLYTSRQEVQGIDSDLALRAAAFENNELLYEALQARSQSGNRARFQEELPQGVTEDANELDDGDDESTLYSQTPNHARSLSLSFPQPIYRPQTNRQAYRPRHRRNTISHPQSHLLLSSGRKTRSQIRLEKELQEREALLRSELATQFKANPVPASTLLPRYHKIKLMSSTRASEARERRAKLLLEQSRPFDFQPQRKKRVSKVKDAKVEETIKKVLQEISKLHAKKEQAKHGYRELSLIVKNAAKDGVDRKRRLDEAATREGLTKEHTFAPKINKNLPNFEKLRQEFAASKSRTKTKEPTIVEPFNLHHIERHVKEDERDRDVDTSLAFRWPFIKTNRVEIAKEFEKGKSTLFHHTKTSLLKKQVNEELARQELERRLAQDAIYQEKVRRSHQLGLLINLKTARARSAGSYQTRDMKQQDEQYRKRLDEMEGRLRQRPFLFEVPNLPSKHKVECGEDVFAKIMKTAGLKPESY